MMDARSSSGSCVPPGFRFHPTDEELVGYYLRKKMASQKIDLDVIRDIDLYRIEPWDLQDKCRIGYEEQKEWYFFSHKDKKYPTGTRTNRATMAGFWKATGRDKAIYDKSKLIGMRKTLVFYKGRAPHGQKTDWIMHEYRLESQENGPPQEEGWVVCRAFKKRLTTGQTKSRVIGRWDSSTYYNNSYNDEPSSSSGVESINVDDYITRQNLVCKQETGPIPDHRQYVQLPQLESPSLPPLKRLPNPILLLAADDNNNNKVNTYNCIDGREDHERYVMGNSSKKVTDWRELDKFVASQLSHGDPYEGLDAESHIDSDLGLLLMQSGREEAAGPRLIDEVPTSDCDIGICIFNK